MKLGILVNTDDHPDAVLGITNAALSKGHEVSIFIMDAGTRLLSQPSIKELSARQKIVMSFCEHSAQGLGVPFDAIPKRSCAAASMTMRRCSRRRTRSSSCDR